MTMLAPLNDNVLTVIFVKEACEDNGVDFNSLKVISNIFMIYLCYDLCDYLYQNMLLFFSSLQERTFETGKNVFYFTAEALFILKIFIF